LSCAWRAACSAFNFARLAWVWAWRVAWRAWAWAMAAFSIPWAISWRLERS
jgi:hypothetical protein